MLPNTGLLQFDVMGDERGSLISLESFANIPFSIARTYYIFNTVKSVRRGYHAHADLLQVAVCVKGSCKFLLDNGAQQCIVTLDSPSKGLFIGPMIWREMFDFSDDSVLLVLASKAYDPADYIRDYEAFREATAK
jgi:dTDP-4-dehydrorhamnose 3,5-epimerase-like enzyme